MKKVTLRIWQILITVFWLVVYIAQKYGIGWIAFPVISHKIGIGGGCLFLMIAVAIMSYIQLRAYDKAQEVLHTISWIHRIKDGDFKKWYEWWLWVMFNSDGRIMFVILATQFDPFLTTVYIRDTGTMQWKPRTIFVLAYVIGIIYSVVVFLISQRLIFG
jgi:hypothetical protein